tara:strand:- start:277 stop:450 length:174 start_codon:yes stop_codon:yes gene_type:complete
VVDLAVVLVLEEQLLQEKVVETHLLLLPLKVLMVVQLVVLDKQDQDEEVTVVAELVV